MPVYIKLNGFVKKVMIAYIVFSVCSSFAMSKTLILPV